ncbi:MAG: DinB family protein [Phycisphaerales bacterium]|nr:DinB family protein [Phycisphaerales bacterium]
MTTSTLDRLSAATINACLKPTIGYAEALLKDIPADKFAFSPHPTMNHPAFVVGHLSIYPNRLLSIMGKSDLAVERPGYDELFKAGTACVADPKKYPGKDELTAYYLDRYKTLASVLESVSDETLAQPNPMEGRLREMFPTIGAATNFMANNHNMMHLGQLSSWRRAMGLPSVM